MTKNDTQLYPMNLLSDCDLCGEWADEHGIIDRLAVDHPLVPINRMMMRGYLYRAVGYRVQQNTKLSDIWSLDDLLSLSAFNDILIAARAHSATSARCLALVLLTVARDWVKVDASHLAALNTIVNQLPSPGFDHRRLHVAASRLHFELKSKAERRFSVSASA